MSISKIIKYGKQGGPGWIQAAVTLGGGSLVGALYLGVIGGYQYMWLQPLAMLCGVIMLAAISYVTLSKDDEDDRPFILVKKHVSPILAWGWLLATVIANVVFCSSQFALAADSIQGNLGFDFLNPYVISTGLFIVAFSLIYIYSREDLAWSKSIDQVIQFLVALVVISFVCAVTVLMFSGAIDWSALLSGFVPDFSTLFLPSDTYTEFLPTDQEGRAFWDQYIISNQRNIIIGAFGAAVGINMTFLLPYTLMRKNWGRADRELARYDLVLGLMIPYLLASSCLIIATASQFHANEEGVVNELAYHEVLDKRLVYNDHLYSTYRDDIKQGLRMGADESDKILSRMLAKRSANDLAKSLEPFLGSWAQLVFGIGVLAMALSTILVHMMMNGYAIGEALSRHGDKKMFLYGAAIPALLGVLSPLIWSGTVKTALVVPASVIATILLPIAYLTFLLLMNSRRALGEELPKRRLLINILMILSSSVALFASLWGLLGKIHSDSLYEQIFGYVGILTLMIMGLLGVISFMNREKVRE